MTHSPHILVVDDDPQIRNGLSKFLTGQGLRVTTAVDGRDLADKLSAARIDLIILDVMMPGDDGFALCRRLTRETDIPVIMLTAVDSETDRVLGLEIGAEDYVCKPFGPRELLARIRVVLRRGNGEKSPTKDAARILGFAGWRLDVRARTLLSPTGVLVELTTGEFELLSALVLHPNRVLNRDQLLDLARGRASLAVDRSIDVQVMRLRRKIELDPRQPQIIKTVRNGGYLLAASVEPEDRET